jgi:hypothetical protein
MTNSTQYPQNWDDLDIRHHIVYYTFYPALLIGVGGPLLAIMLLVAGVISPPISLLVSVVAMDFMCIYLYFLADYVIPAQTYRKYRSGEWDNSKYN